MEQGGNHGGLPVPRPVRRLITTEDTLQAYEELNHELGRKGFPLPRRAPEIEGKVWEFNRDRDGTGDALGDLIKRAVFNRNNYVGDKRREILRVLPLTRANRKLYFKLSVELIDLEKKLADKLKELNETMGTNEKKPDHFNSFPALKD